MPDEDRPTLDYFTPPPRQQSHALATLGSFLIVAAMVALILWAL
jgi:hypothetical protein